MRSHHAPAVAQPEPQAIAPPQLEPAFAVWIAEQADFHTSTYPEPLCHCQLCGQPISWGELIAAATPTRPDATQICWQCLVSILMFRGMITAAAPSMPDPHGLGTFEPRYEVLEVAYAGDRRPYGPALPPPRHA